MYTLSQNPDVIDTYSAMATSWKVEVSFRFETVVNHVSFFEVQFNNQQQKLFALQIRGKWNKLMITDFADDINGLNKILYCTLWRCQNDPSDKQII